MKTNNKGLSIIAAIITIMLLTIASLTATGLLSIRSNISSNDLGSKRALYIAEAGLARTMHTLRSDWSMAGDPANFPTTAFADGFFSVDIELIDPDQALVTVTGVSGDSSRVINSLITRDFAGMFENAIHSNGSVDLRGNATINGDILYSNNYYAGGNVNVNGDTTRDNVEIPALDTNQAISNAQSNALNGYSSRPAGNYFQGNFAPNNPSSLNGVIFIDAYPDGSPANVNISGNISTNDGNPAVLIVMGDLRISGNILFNGLLYTSGSTDIDITLSGNLRINGAIVSSGDISIMGNCIINYREDLLSDDVIGDVMLNSAVPQEESWQEISSF